jgi:hypothetical protein
VVAAGAVFAVLLSGATEVGFVRDRVQNELSERLGPDYRVSVGKAIVQVDPALGLAIDLEAIEVAHRNGSVAAVVPVTRLAVDAVALLRLRLAVTRAEVRGPRLTLTSAGAVDGSSPELASAEPSEGPASAGGGFSQAAAAIGQFDQVLEAIIATRAARGIRIAVSEGSVEFRDGANATTHRIAGIDLGMKVEDDTGNLKVDLTATGTAGRWTADLGRRTDRKSGERVLTASVSQLTLADAFPALAAPDSEVSVDSPLFGTMRLILDRDSALVEADARLEVGAGVIRFGDRGEAQLLDEAAIAARWDVAESAVVIQPSPVQFGDTRATLTGLLRDEGGGRYAFAIESHDAVLAPRDSDEAPLAAELIEVSGVMDAPERTLSLDRVIIQTDQGSFAGAARLGFTGETPSLAAAAELTAMDVGVWKQMWPPLLAPGARRWALRNFVDGRIASARFDAAVPAGVLFRREPPEMPAGAFNLDVRLEDAAVRTFGGLPPISGASGRLVISGETLGIDLDTGAVLTPSGAKVGVTAGAFAIDDVFNPRSEGVIEVALSGEAGPMGEIANSEPFRVLGRRGLTPADLSGKTEASVSVRVPLEIDEGQDAGALVDWKVTVAATDLASRKPVDGRTFSDADVTIVVTKDEATVDGSARIDGVVAAVSIAQPLSEGGADAAGAVEAASLALDREARLKLGLDIEDIVSGTVDAQVRSLDGRDGQHYDLDLRRARLVIPGLGWSKGVGVPATMRFDVLPEEGGSRIENMELVGEGFGFVGSARLKDGEGLVSASVDKFRLRPGDDVAFELTLDDAGYAIVARGASFDVRGVIAELFGDVEDGGDTSNISVEARVRKAKGYNDRTINDAVMKFVARNGVPRVLDLTGKMRGKPVSVAYSDDLSRASLQSSAGDAGAVYEFLDVYTRIGGGHLAVVAERPGPSGPLTGTLSMTNFAILNEPAMEQVVSRARPRNGAKVDTKRMHVEQMDAVFRYTGDEIFVDDAFLRGAAIGATFNGVFDLARSFVSMSGTYIPVYGINNAFSKVPVVGRILGGENAEGLIGVTFKVEGPIDGPRVFVNPLSAVAPGIFRKIFEFR